MFEEKNYFQTAFFKFIFETEWKLWKILNFKLRLGNMQLDLGK